MNTPDNCYLDKGHDAHDLLGRFDTCPACGFSPSREPLQPEHAMPRDLAEAVARLTEAAEYHESLASRIWRQSRLSKLAPLEARHAADLRLVLAALAEVQRDRDAEAAAHRDTVGVLAEMRDAMRAIKMLPDAAGDPLAAPPSTAPQALEHRGLGHATEDEVIAAIETTARRLERILPK